MTLNSSYSFGSFHHIQHCLQSVQNSHGSNSFLITILPIQQLNKSACLWKEDNFIRKYHTYEHLNGAFFQDYMQILMAYSLIQKLKGRFTSPKQTIFSWTHN